MEKLFGRHGACCLHPVLGKMTFVELVLQLVHLHRSLHPTVTVFAEDRHCLHFLSRLGALHGSSVGGLPMQQNGRDPTAQWIPSVLRAKVADLLA